MRSLKVCTFTTLYSVVQVKKDDMDGACSTCVREERCMLGSGGVLRTSDHLEDLGVDGRILLKWKFKKLDTAVDCIDPAQDRNRFIGVYEYSGSIKCGKFN
jgi:hypothetical protein